ncbi:MAG TPA: D-alanyl-D-alanine carboxypeptidase/D-alanyl-D-alanine-endopeptidase [Planctomycetaceae bacterium]|nr:D-alanyl-D-alanine carboxypeptidase/D-alanyl-D-alanine-endopeptidase [Planctomycetaceae bacterium]
MGSSICRDSVCRALSVLLACATTAAGRSTPAGAAEMKADGPQSSVRAARPAQGTHDRARALALDARIQEILRRPEFRNARWGMKFYSPNTKDVIYSLNPDQLFNPGSAMKVFIAGTAFTSLGPDYRFHTPVYRTGPVENGVLKGDLVLVASGDLLLGGRVQPDGTLALPERDHTYDMSPDAVPVSANPLRSIEELARQIAASGIKRVKGRVLVDASLFREAKGEAGGIGEITISPMMINDNLVDVLVTPGTREGEPGTLRVSPQTAYVKVLNNTRTTAGPPAPPGGMRLMGPGALRFADDLTNADGSHAVTLTGNIPLGSQPILCAYHVPEPPRFAATLLAEALRAKDVAANVDPRAKLDYQALSAFYRPQNRVAELISPPLFDEVKPMLKLSSNPHTLHFPYIVGAIAGHDNVSAPKTGRKLQQELFLKAGVLEGAKTGGELGTDCYSADAFIPFLTYMSQQAWFPEYLRALPIMGKDGTVAKVQMNSPAAGHIYAKTGTAVMMRADSPNADPRHTSVDLAKALAGYIELPDGRLIVFAEFLDLQGMKGFKGFAPFDQVMGEIASAVYDSLASRSR